MKRAKKTHSSEKNPSRSRHLIVIVAVCCVVFANSLSGSFVWDDEIQILKNWRIRSFENLPSAFTSAFWSFLGTDAESQTNFYRPIQTITYMVAYAVGGLSPGAYHVLSLLYHVAASVFVYLICIELMFVPAIALAAAVLFAVHPVHTEAIAWIAGTPDVACGAFYFGSVWFFLRYLKTQRRPWLLASSGAFLAALLAKEMAVTLPVFLLLLLISRHRDVPLKTNLLRVAPLFLVLGLYVVLRVAAIGALAGSHIDAQASWLDWISLGGRVLGEYFRYALLPYPMNAFHLVPLKLDYRIGSTLLATVAVLVLAGLTWRFRHRIPDGPVWFAAFALMLVPVFYFKGMSNVFFAERYLYIPSFAMIGLVCSAVSSMRVRHAGVILGCVAAVFGVATIYRNRAWSTSEQLYETTLQTQPEVAHMRINLADIHMKRGDDAGASALLESSIRYIEEGRYVVFPYELYRAYVGLGAIAARVGDYATARAHLQKAIEINPRGDWGYLYLGGIFMEADGDYPKAIDHFKKAIELGPLNEVARDYLGIAMLNQKNYREAIQYFEEAIRINPTYEDARNHLAVASRALTQ